MHAFKKLWSLLTLTQKKSGVFLFVLILIGTIMEIVGLGLVVPLVAVMTSPDFLENNTAFIIAQNICPYIAADNIIFFILGAMLCIYLIKTVFLVYLAWAQAGFNLNIQADLSKRLFQSYLNRPWLIYKKGHSAAYIQNTNNEVQILIQQGYGAAFEIITNVALLAAATALLLIMEPTGTLIIMGMMAISFWVFQYISRIRVSHWGRIRKEHESRRLQCLQQGLNSTKEIKLWNCAPYFIEAFHKHSLNLISAGRWQSTLRKFPRHFFELLAVIGLVTAIIVMHHNGKPLADIAPIIALFTAIFIKLMPSANAILTGLHSIRYIQPTIHTIHEELATPYPYTKTRNSKAAKAADITLEDITFSYTPDKTALKNINLTIPHGKSVAIIGTSGAGKSTLVDTILGLIKPDQGQVKTGKTNIHKNIHTWQSQIGYVPQSIYLLDDTLRRNIAFGLPDTKIDNKKIIKVIKQAQLQTLVKNLPNGIDTMLGENGGRLSGGEKQRIALARALYKDPSILILDEATASLDTTTERDVMQAVHALKGKRTIINITHKPSVTKLCDVIITIKNGTITHVKENNV